MSGTIYDFAVIGAGMAGTSLAAHIAPYASVLCLEAEDRPGYHATGRSAAFWEECYGGPDVAPLTIASGAFLREHGFLRPRGALYIGKSDNCRELDDFIARFDGGNTVLERVGAEEIQRKVPGLRPAWNDAVWQNECADIDVAGLHAYYMAQMRSAGADLIANARIVSAEHSGAGWLLTDSNGRQFMARQVVNAAGAWADEFAQMAGCKPLGITPLRRTVVQLRVEPFPSSDLPLVLDIGGGFYFKPENGRLWLSPHDETPSVPCDAAPEELDIAQAIDRFEQVVDWSISAVETKWAGLRSFALDRLPVYGYDPAVPDFYWFAGQGGFGIQTAPAAAQIAKAQLLGSAGGPSLAQVNIANYSPERFSC